MVPRNRPSTLGVPVGIYPGMANITRGGTRVPQSTRVPSCSKHTLGLVVCQLYKLRNKSPGPASIFLIFLYKAKDAGPNDPPGYFQANKTNLRFLLRRFRCFGSSVRHTL